LIISSVLLGTSTYNYCPLNTMNFFYIRLSHTFIVYTNSSQLVDFSSNS
jgi:hypothetical protein